MSAMHDDSSPDLKIVGTKIKEILEVYCFYCSKVHMDSFTPVYQPSLCTDLFLPRLAI